MSLVIPDGARYERDIGVRLYSAAYGTQKRLYMSFSNLNPPSQPELFRFTEGISYSIHYGVASFFFPSSVNDNDELLSRARMLLVRMCGVTPPRPLIGPILNAIFDTILNSPVRRSLADL